MKTANPYTVTITNIWDSIANWKTTCDCKAGAIICKHKICVLLYLCHNELSLMTCTEKEQSWGVVSRKQANKVYAPQKLKTLCCFKAKFISKQPISISEKTKSAIQSLFKKELPTSGFAKNLVAQVPLALNEHDYTYF